MLMIHIKHNVSKIIILILLFSLTSTFKAEALLLKNILKNSSTSELSLVLDNKNYNKLPHKFRKSTNIKPFSNNLKFNQTGLDTLNISGSQQFSEMNLPILINAINTKLPIIDIDLRQESHGFINGIPVSWKNSRNDANKELTNSQVLEKENELLSSIKINVPITFSNDSNLTLIPETVLDENKLVSSNNIKYYRVFATDEELPSNETIDSFLNIIKEIDNNSWIHFHCKEGIVRTTEFMIFYDMLRNYKDVSAEDIINRQTQLSVLTLSDIKRDTSLKRINLFNSFYNYCKENGDELKITYSDYIKNKPGI